MKAVFRLSAIFVVVALLQSCWAFKDLEYKGIEGYKVEEVSFYGIKVKLAVNIANPNFYKIKATGGEMEVIANKINLGKFQLADELVLPKKSDGTVYLTVETKYKNLLGGSLLSLIGMFRNGGQVEIQLNGHINASALGISKKIDISTTEMVGL